MPVNEFLELFLTFAKIGVMTFGGGYAMLPILQREVVENKHWATEEELTSIDDVGPITAAYIRQWMESPQSRDLLRRLEDAGVNMSCKEELVDNRFAGMTFVLTGSLERFTREEAGQMIEQRGGKSASSVSKKTSYVVAGPGAGSKLRRAQELNIPVLTEEEFLELLK